MKSLFPYWILPVLQQVVPIFLFFNFFFSISLRKLEHMTGELLGSGTVHHSAVGESRGKVGGFFIYPASTSSLPWVFSRRKVRVLHGVEAVDGVSHAGLQGAHLRRRHEAVAEAGERRVAVDVVEGRVVTCGETGQNEAVSDWLGTGGVGGSRRRRRGLLLASQL